MVTDEWGSAIVSLAFRFRYQQGLGYCRPMPRSSVHLQKCRSCKKLNVLDQSNLIRFFVTTSSKLVGTSRLIDIPVVINSSGMPIRAHRNCPHLKKGHWYALDLAMTGDAPKDFLSVYEYGAPGCKRGRRKSWPRYIAKVGHKWYPNESITEHLITRLGQSLMMDIADSRIMHVRGQVRFFSRYFLKGSEYLLHGADIFASYLEDHDKAFVQGVEDEGKSPEFFDYDFVAASIRAMLPDTAELILQKFHRMLAFDALIGNNDRHFFNWGVICDQTGRQNSRFSPIFDTARALFWNHSEERLSKMECNGRCPTDQIRKYCRESFSKIGAACQGRVNHFALLDSVLNRYPATKADFDILAGIDSEPVDLIEILLKGEFARLISPKRRTWICRLLDYRTEQFRKTLKGEPTDA